MKPNFYEIGISFGKHISKCSEASIISLIAERSRMIKSGFGEEEVNEFKFGVLNELDNKNLLYKETPKHTMQARVK